MLKYINNIISGGLGAIFGASVVSVFAYIKRTKLSKQNKNLQEQIDSLRKRLGDVDDELQKKTTIKVQILKQLVWKDRELDNKEKTFITNYILNNKYLDSDIKILLIKDIDTSPPFVGFNKFFKIFKAAMKFDEIFISKEDAIGFVEIMKELSTIDEVLNKSEEEYIKSFKKYCDIN